MRNFSLILIGVFLLVLSLVFRGGDRAPQAVQSNVNKPKPPDKVAVEEVAGWSSLAIREGYLSIRFKLLGRCEPGDFDVLKEIRRLKPTAKFLVTVENTQSDEVLLSQQIALEDISGGTIFRVPHKWSGLVQQYAIFVCSDTEGKKACQKKRVADVNEIFAQAMPDAKSQRDTWDRVIVMQPLVSTQNRAFVLSSIEHIPPSFHRNLLAQLTPSSTKNFSTDALYQTVVKSQTIGSLPVELDRDVSTIDLIVPGVDSAACQSFYKK